MAKKSYHFSFGNSTVGPIGMSGAIWATSRKAALKKLRKLLPETIEIDKAWMPLEDDVEYINVYLNTGKITVADIDEA